MKKFILLVAIITTIISEPIPPVAKYRLKMHTQFKESCTTNAKDNLCYKITLKYPKRDILRDEISKILGYEIEKAQKDYNKTDPKDAMADICIADWIDKTSIELFDYAYDFVTVGIRGYSYTGGAHGHYFLELKVYPKDSNKSLKLKDIIPIQKSLNTIKRYYRIESGILPKEPLINFDKYWFEDISDVSFAMSDDGILFIKENNIAYTSFVVPYYALKGIVDKKSPIYNIVKESHKRAIDIEKNIKLLNKVGVMKISIKSITNNRLKLDVSLELERNYKNIWLSIGFPQLKSQRYLSNIGFSGFDDMQEYPAGSRIYNNSTKRAFYSFYLLEEGYKRHYYAYDELSSSWIVTPPKSLDILCMEFRVTTRDRRKIKNLTENVKHGFVDQQEFISHRVCIDL